jgi:hypothetical protein
VAAAAILTLVSALAAASPAVLQSPAGPDLAGPPTNRDSGSIPLPRPTAVPGYLSAPKVTDVDNNDFSVSWVADQPINSSVEYCQEGGGCSSAALAGTTTTYDILQYNMSHVALVRVTGLSQATKYYYRAVSRNASGGVNYSPAAAPYPSVTTKNHPVDTGNTVVAIFWIRPFEDVDVNDAWGSPPDRKALKFIAYLNHTPHGGSHLTATVPMAIRAPCAPEGIGDCNVIPFLTTYTRNDDAVGGLHPINSGDTVTFFVAGVHHDGTERRYYWNSSTSMMSDGTGGVQERYVPLTGGQMAFDEIEGSMVIAAAMSSMLAILPALTRRRNVRR